MLLNLTNHPLAAWSSEQRAAAEAQFGAIQDMPFPNIPPHWTDAEVAQLAQEYADKIAAMPAPLTVHLMGEMTFTCTLVRRLQARGIACVASTSERISEEKPDGQKLITFRFVQFRAYP